MFSVNTISILVNPQHTKKDYKLFLPWHQPKTKSKVFF